MGTRLEGGALPYGSGGPVSANTVVPWPVQPKPEPKPSPIPTKDADKGPDAGTPTNYRRIPGDDDRRPGQDLGGFKDPSDSLLGRFASPKDEVDLGKSPNGSQREKAEAFLARNRRRSAPLIGQKTSGLESANDELSTQLRSNLTRSRLELSQRRPGLR